ncbi:unnamed protein product [Rotaria sp. Silwood1]|nr:unnamed protein product [Rotaria sp. Silwood1]
MVIYSQNIVYDVLPLLMLVSFLRFSITKATSTLSLTNDDNNNNNDNQMRRADEYVMTSARIDGIKRSNVCGDGYRIEGALLKSYSYSDRESYLPYEDCYMTFKARQSDNQIRIRILSLDLNDIHNGINCLDSLRFYKSVYITKQDKLDTVECGQLTEQEKFHVISPTGIVTAHFSTDGGNVNGQGFKVVLTAFRYPNKTHPCDSNNEEFLCRSKECISSLLLCDGVPHCLDNSDELSDRSCASKSLNSELNNRITTSKRQHWRGILIAAFLLIILFVFILFMIYLICRRCIHPPMPLTNHANKNYATMLNSSKTGSKTTTTTQVVVQNDKIGKRLDDDYNIL